MKKNTIKTSDFLIKVLVITLILFIGISAISNSDAAIFLILLNLGMLFPIIVFKQLKKRTILEKKSKTVEMKRNQDPATSVIYDDLLTNIRGKIGR